MPFFQKKVNSYIGVDLGTAGIKVVELANTKGHAQLLTYGIVESSADVVRSNAPETINKVVELIKTIISKSHVTTDRAVAALPAFSVFSSILSLPPMPKSDLAQAVKWEAKKFVPMPLDEMILDWKLLKNIPPVDVNKLSTSDIEKTEVEKIKADDENSFVQKKEIIANEEKQNHRVLITAAPKNLVSRYLEIFKKANLKLISLEIESFALARSLFFGAKLPIMIIDIGSLTTTISIIEDGVPILNRSLDVGGATLTQAISTSLNIDRRRAEQFKRDIGIANTNASSGIPKVIERALNPVINEVKYSLNLYQSQTAHGIEKVILVGGSAFLPNITDYLSQILNLNVYLGDPWFRVSYPEDLKLVLEEVGSRLAVAVGLGMRDID
jgi:type IV pilus assembly protein PilM